MTDSFFRLPRLRPGTLAILISFLSFIVLALPVEAHHPIENLSPKDYNIWQGIISGLAHPVFGVDHLIFLMSIGLTGLVSIHGWLLPLIGCTLAGSLGGLISPPLLMQEAWVGLSLIALAVVALRSFPPVWVLPLIAIHGYVLAGTMVGAKLVLLAGYLCGLVLSELIIIIGGFLLIRRFQPQLSLLAGIITGFGLSVAGAAVLS